ncbi:MAG TPA: type II CAAX endopeptidase family protein [Acidimicrobiia bacterium]|nr:type II CAAX endopeptidase family protein [Acidimicrobiia bacterium]
MPRPWSLTDFFFVILGGFIGAALFVAVSEILGGEEMSLVLALTGQYLGHLLVLWLLSRRKDHPDLGFAIEGRDLRYLGIGLVLQLGLAIAFLPLSSLLFPEGESAQQVGTAIAGLETTTARVAAMVTAVVLAPVTEELIFRGILLKTLEARGRRTIMVVTSLVFAAFHLLGLDPGRMLEAAAVVLPQLFLVGLVLAWVTLRSKRLGPAIFIHSGFNLLAAVVLLLPPELLETVGQ